MTRTSIAQLEIETRALMSTLSAERHALDRARRDAMRSLIAELPDPADFARTIPLIVADHLMTAAPTIDGWKVSQESAALLRRWGLCDFTSRYFGGVVRKRWITLERGARGRVVTIVETGKRTAGEVSGVHWRDRDPAELRANHEPRPAPKPKPFQRDLGEMPMDIASRIDRDQAARLAQRERWLAIEQEKYGLPTRGRSIDEMPA